MSDHMPDESENTANNGEERSHDSVVDPENTGDKISDAHKSEVPARNNEAESFISFLKELPVLIITAVVIAYVIKWLIIQPFYIPSPSMEPTLIPDDRVLVAKFIYRFGNPTPGDIIVFVAPTGENRDYIKRIVAVGGDKVEVRDGDLLVNDKPAPQDYETMPGDYSNWGPEVIRKDHVMVMGDNRPNSADGRVFGQLREDAILGKAFMIYWPLDRISLFE
ncbi:MAG TPA: signal peptidase I [Actinobacteria bacterium]|nr:signal peptidase I [Actinomycetota bacterium]